MLDHVIQGRGHARELGIQKHRLAKAMQTSVFIDFGPSPAGDPGMTMKRWLPAPNNFFAWAPINLKNLRYIFLCRRHNFTR